MIWIFILSLLLVAPSVEATTYYVSKTASNGYAVGSDSNSCVQAQSKATPKSTIWGTSGGKVCQASGDTIIVNEGTYTEEILNPVAGTASAYTTIKADPASSRPLIRPDGVAAKRGLYCSTGAACHHIRLEGFDISGAYNSVKLATPNAATGYPHHVQIVNNILHDTRSTNIECNTSDTTAEGGDHLIQGNEFYNTGIFYPDDHAGATYAPGHNTIYNPGNRTIVEKNVFHNVHNGVGIWTSNKYLYDVIVRDNLFYNIGLTTTDTWQAGASGYACIHVSSGGGRHRIHNNVCRDSGQDPAFRAINVNPQFGKTTITDIQIYNNTVYNLKNASAYGIRASVNVQVAGSVIVTNNISIAVLGASISDESGLVAMVQTTNRTTGTPTALWTSPSTGDLTLKAGSAAIDSGTPMGLLANGGLPEQGAYEVPIFSSCEVRRGEASKVRVRFTNNVRPPMLPATSVAGVTFRKDGASNEVVSSARVGDNEYDFTVTTAFGPSDPVDMSIVPASTNLTDSSLIGNSINQKFLSTITNQTCTNSLSGISMEVISQVEFRFHYAYGLNEASPRLRPSGDTIATAGTVHRLRIKLINVVFDLGVTGFQLRVSYNGGAYVAVQNSYVNHVKMYAQSNSEIPAGVVTTRQLPQYYATFLPGLIIDAANAVPAIDFTVDSETELEYVLEYESSAVLGDTYDYRLYHNDGSPLSAGGAYVVTPRVTIAEGESAL